MSYVARLNNVRRVPLYRSSFALMLTTGLNGILGFAYWVLAARLYPAKAVGIGAGAISAMTLVSSLGWVGLQFVLLRYVPVAGRAQARLVRLCYAAAIGIALVATGIFLAGFARLAGLGILTESPLTVLLFGASIVFWVVFSLQDPALIGLRRAGWVPIENATFGAIKAVLLVALAASASAWAVSFSFRLLAVNMSNALIVEGALAESKVQSLVRQVSRMAFVVVIPLVVVVVVAADPIMAAFGPKYTEAANLLRLFAVSLIPFTILNFVIAVERIRERVGRALLIAGASTALTIGLDLWLIPSRGLTGAGWGWLFGQTLGAAIAVWLTLGRRSRS